MRFLRSETRPRRADPRRGAPTALPPSCRDCVHRLTGRCPTWPLGAL